MRIKSLLDPLKAIVLITSSCLVLTSQAHAAGVWNLNYGIDPVTGWATNGVDVESVKVGSTTTGGWGAVTAAPVVVNGINFTTSPTLTTNWGAGYWGDDNVANIAWYAGSDTNVQSLYQTWRDVVSWGSPTFASFRFPNLTPGHVYQAEVVLHSGWGYAAANIYATGDGGTNWSYQYFGAPDNTSVNAAKWTWQANTNFGGIDLYLNGWSSIQIYGYTLRDLSVGPPVFYVNATLSPANTVYAGASITLAASSAGALPLSYQWRKGGVAISGATNATYVNSSTVVTDSGSYDLEVSNSQGTNYSVAQSLTVLPAVPPFLTAQPLAASRLQHSAYVFVAGADGSGPLKFQWKKDNVAITGATNTTLSLTNIGLSAAGYYVLTVTNSFGITNTAPVTLTVTPGLALNPLFGDGGGSVTNYSFNNWGWEGWAASDAALDPTYGTCARVNGNWNTIYQNTGSKFASNMLYTLTAAITGPNGSYMTIEDAGSGLDQTNWTSLIFAIDSFKTLDGAPYADYSVSFDTTLNPAVVGNDIGIRFREASPSGETIRVANVRLTAQVPPVILSNPANLGGGNFSFTITSAVGATINVLVSTNLVNWTTLTTVVNASGADTFTDNNATGSAKFYRVQVQ